MKRLVLITLLLAGCKDSGKAPPAAAAKPDANVKELMAQAHDDFVKAVDPLRKRCGLGLAMGRYPDGKGGHVWKGQLVGPMRAGAWEGQVEVTFVLGPDGKWTCRDADSRAASDEDAGGEAVASPCKLVADTCGR